MSSKGNPKDFGQYLLAQRIQKGISLEAVSRLTRVSMTSLRQIENEDLANLPAPVYVKGFLRAYAEAVGADPQPALERYDACLLSLAETRQAHVETKAGRPFLPRAIIAVLLMVVTVALTIFAYSMLFTSHDQPPVDEMSAAGRQTQVPAESEAPETEAPSAPPAHIQPEATAPAPTETPQPASDRDETSTQNVSATPPTAAAVEEQTAAPVEEPPAEVREQPVAELRLRLKALEETWLKITPDQSAPKEYILKAGEELVVQAESTFDLLIGNAGGLKLWLDDRPVEVKGGSGKVVRLKLP